jgi:hypothetical protein
MKTRILSALLLFIFSPVGQALACPFCYGAKDGKSTEHMAVAIWFLFGAVMSVLGGIGAFIFGGTDACLPSRIRRSPRKI